LIAHAFEHRDTALVAVQRTRPIAPQLQRGALRVPPDGLVLQVLLAARQFHQLLGELVGRVGRVEHVVVKGQVVQGLHTLHCRLCPIAHHRPQRIGVDLRMHTPYGGRGE
jgi:hypothetical protein